ncbi:hypothetical protein [Hazenella coriacea]|uniref:Helix-turn-helix protein n=1 Tax=Hazenella coriacea TaxID=1179467 RepID=A0A4R3L1G5_9BACL|nr:hypothetical protein [Hazenella coriacea]TCS92214.1 hypothetical protein EDD58_1145 [Hazenella coriacea]
MEMLRVPEVTERLKQNGIEVTDQVLRKWLREGDLKGIRASKKEGWKVSGDELERFISEKNPLYREVKRLKEENARLVGEIQQLKNELERLKSSPSTLASTPKPQKEKVARELRREEVHQIYINSMDVTSIPTDLYQGGAHAVFENAYKKLESLVFGENDVTDLYKPKTHKTRPYQCPGTGKNFGTPEKVILCLGGWLIEREIKSQKKKMTIRGNGIIEITKDEAMDIFSLATKKVKNVEIRRSMLSEYMGLLFPPSLFEKYETYQEASLTDLYDQESKKYICPMTHKKCRTSTLAAESLMKAILGKYKKVIEVVSDDDDDFYKYMD